MINEIDQWTKQSRNNKFYVKKPPCKRSQGLLLIPSPFFSLSKPPSPLYSHTPKRRMSSAENRSSCLFRPAFFLSLKQIKIEGASALQPVSPVANIRSTSLQKTVSYRWQKGGEQGACQNVQKTPPRCPEECLTRPKMRVYTLFNTKNLWKLVHNNYLFSYNYIFINFSL